MPLFSRRSRNNPPKSKAVTSAPPVVESLENRAMMSADIIVTIAGALPQSAISGGVVNDKIGVNIANSGPDRAFGHALFTLFASFDTTLSVDDAQVLTRPLPINIGAGRNHTYRLNVRSFPQNLNGNYFILGQVSSANVATTIAPSASTIAIIPPKIDLAATLVRVPTNGHVGRKISVFLDITNGGNVSAKGSLAVAFSVSANPDGSSPFALGALSRHILLRAGRHVLLHYFVPLPFGIPSGNQYVVANVDPSNVFLDPSLANNLIVSLTPVSVS